MKGTTERIVIVIGAALASAALVVGGATAAVRPDDRGGPIGVGAAQLVTAPDAFERAFAREAAESVAPDAFERAVAREAAESAVPDAFERAVRRSTSASVRPDDRAGLHGAGIVPSALRVESTMGDDGFRVADALLGAGGMLGIMVVGAAGTLAIRRRGKLMLP